MRDPSDCPPGQIWNASTERCEPGTGVNCPPGQTWNASTQKCESTEGPNNCPPGKVWRPDTNKCEYPDERSKAGKETCPGTPPTCPPGQGSWCDFDSMSWKCAPNGESGGGKPGGGGGAGTPKPATGGAVPMPGQGTNDIINAYLQSVLGGNTSFSPDVVDRLKSSAKSAAEGSTKASMDALRESMVQRGTFRSPAENRMEREVRMAGDRNYSQAVNEIQVKKTLQDFQDKMGAIDRSQKWLDSLRQYTVSMTGISTQKDIGMANVALGYANLQNQWSMLQANLQQQMQMFQQGNFFQGLPAWMWQIILGGGSGM